MASSYRHVLVAFVSLFLLGGWVRSYAQDADFDLNTKKRDPFVALLYSDGNIKTEAELFPQESIEKRPIDVNITIKAIIWDEARPLVMIGKKIYSVGEEIQDKIIIDKIEPNSITIKRGEDSKTITLRKPRGLLLK